MTKQWKKILAFLTSAFLLSGMIGASYAPVISRADEPPAGSGIEIIIDGTMNETLKQSVFDVNGTNVVVQFADNLGSALQGTSLSVADASNETVLATLSSAVASVTGYDPDTMHFILESRDGDDTSRWFTCALAYSGGNFTREDGGDGGILAQGEFHLNLVAKQSGGTGEPGSAQGGSIAHIEISSSDGTWQGVPCVREDFYPRGQGAQEDTVTWNYTEMHSWQFCQIMINSGRMEGFVDGDARYSENPRTSVDCEYEPKDDPDTVDVTFSFNWSYRPEEIIGINGREYRTADYVDFDDERDWLDAFSFEYRNQDISVTIPDVPANIDAEGVANLSIVMDLRPITEEECYIGNFLWSSRENPDNPHDDQYIGHSELELISATYPARLGGTTFDEETLEAESRMEKRNKTAKYITYGVTDGDGEMVLPIGTKVTMRVAPEFGYQVTAFRINGEPIEQGGYEPGTDVAVYTFFIDSANFHLGADVVPVDNQVEATGAESVSGGSVSLGQGEGCMTVGTAKLEVEDAELSEAQVSGFENAAEGGVISDIIDISLFNTVYKGTADESWDTPVHELEKKATITLKLDEGTTHADPFVIHQKSDGSYETLETTYDAETNTISFETSSFSNYAIADKEEPTQNLNLKWYVRNGKGYWYEEGVRQGTESDPKSIVYDGTVRGREIYDPESERWYWLDANADGAAAVGKEVFIPYVYQNEKDMDDGEKRWNAEQSDADLADYIYDNMINGHGKWVRYDENGGMMKGWVTITEGSVLASLYQDQVGNTYYYDNKTGAMVHGDVTIDGVLYQFDPITGVCQNPPAR